MVRRYARLCDEPGYGRLLDYLEDACSRGLPVPPYDDVADMLMITRAKVRRYMSAMINAKIIRVQGQNAKWRVTWVATGQTSAPRGKMGVPDGGYIDDRRLHEAKNYLRRIYANVYDSRVIGGPRGYVEIDGVGRVTAARAIELAEQKGWTG